MIHPVSPTQSAARLTVARCYLLDLRWAGRIYRLSTTPISITDDTGVSRQYRGGIINDPGPAHESNRTGSGDASPSVALVVSLDGEDVASLISEGWRPQEATASLFEVGLTGAGVPAQSWAERMAHIINGRLTRPTTDDPDDPVSVLRLTLEAQPFDLSATLLDPEAVIDETTWPDVTSASDSMGKAYPVVIGYPGTFNRSDGQDGATSGSPAYAVEYTGDHADTLLICDGDVDAAEVRVFSEDGSSTDVDVRLNQDAQGRWVSTVDISSESTAFRKSNRFYVRWRPGDGGILNPFAPGVLRYAGDVMRWMLMKAPNQINFQAWAAESGILNRYPIDTFFNDSEETYWDALTELMDAIPGMGTRLDANGLRPVLRRRDYPDTRCAGHIRQSPGSFYPLTPWTYQANGASLINDLTVKFARRLKTGRYRRLIRAQPSNLLTDAITTATSHARASQDQLSGESRSKVVELSWLYDEAGAGSIAMETIRLSGFDYRARDYMAAHDWDWLEVNEVYLFSDDLWSDVQVEVIRKEPTTGGTVITLAFDDDPAMLGTKLN